MKRRRREKLDVPSSNLSYFISLEIYGAAMTPKLEICGLVYFCFGSSIDKQLRTLR